MPPIDAPSVGDIRDAADRLAGVAVRTPLLEFDAINALAGGRVLLKCETFQQIGSFKIRGAWNRIARLPADERSRGVVAFSSGNHAQAVARSARRMGIAATIVMPSDAPAVKIARTRSDGARVVPYDRASGDREAISQRIVEKTGAAIVPPYDHPDVIAGQGTVGLEIAAQCAALGVTPDAVAVPCSGGGLVAGCAIALRDAFPGTEIHPVEPEGYDDTVRSLVAGRRLTADAAAPSICDALLVGTPGRLTFEINRRLLAGGAVVSDGEVLRAMGDAFRHARLVLEPGGAVALAAVLGGKIDARGRTVCVVCSGGNVDPLLFADAIRSAGFADV